MEKLREEKSRVDRLHIENHGLRDQISALIKEKTRMIGQLMQQDAKIEAFDTMLADAFYDI